MFNWITNLFTRSMPAPSNIYTALMTQSAINIPPNSTGMPVNQQTALTISACYAACRTIAETLSSLPLYLYKETPDGKEPAIDHPLYNMLLVAPNEQMTANVMRNTLLMHLYLWGNSFLEIVRKGNGAVDSLWLLQPYQCQILREPTHLQYYISGVPFDQSDLCHFRLVSLDGIWGLSPVMMGRQSMGRMLAQETSMSNLWSNGCFPSGILTFPGRLGDKAEKNIVESWHQAYGGVRGAGKVPLLQDGITFTPTAFSPADMQFLDSAKWSTQEVSRWFGVPVSKLGDSTTKTNEQENLNFVTQTIRPLAEKLEAELNFKLLLPQERGKYFFKHDLTELMRGDMSTLANTSTRLVQWGILNPNEARHWFDLAPYSEGNDYLSPANWKNVSDPSPDNKATKGIDSSLAQSEE